MLRVPHRGHLKRFVEFAEDHQEAGAVGRRVLNLDGKLRC